MIGFARCSSYPGGNQSQAATRHERSCAGGDDPAVHTVVAEGPQPVHVQRWQHRDRAECERARREHRGARDALDVEPQREHQQQRNSNVHEDEERKQAVAHGAAQEVACERRREKGQRVQPFGGGDSRILAEPVPVQPEPADGADERQRQQRDAGEPREAAKSIEAPEQPFAREVRKGDGDETVRRVAVQATQDAAGARGVARELFDRQVCAAGRRVEHDVQHRAAERQQPEQQEGHGPEVPERVEPAAEHPVERAVQAVRAELQRLKESPDADTAFDGWVEPKYLHHALAELKLQGYWPELDAEGARVVHPRGDVGEDGQREDLASRTLRFRARPGPVVQVGKAGLEMEREGVVDGAPDPPRGQVGLQLVPALGAQRVLVVDALGVRVHVRGDHLRDVGEGLVVVPGVHPPGLAPGGQVGELGEEHRGLQGVQPAVAAHHIVVIALALPMVGYHF